MDFVSCSHFEDLGEIVEYKLKELFLTVDKETPLISQRFNNLCYWSCFFK